MRKSNFLQIAVAVVGLYQTPAFATCSWSTIANGTTADATQVMNNFDCVAPIRSSGGNVGIGTTSPNANLEVSGSSGIRVSGATDPTILLLPSSGSTQNATIHQVGNTLAIGGFGVSNAFAMDLNAPSTAIYVDSSSRVGIGTTAPGYLLTVMVQLTPQGRLAHYLMNAIRS